MALRVLLADESASIRKVFQLGLQDFGAEVKSVHNGLDVIEVAEQFKPDIIFADILLQKKNGYEVSEEIRGHASLKSVPVVLMWSSFMELDQKKYKSCGAAAEMEKPFEVDVMRRHISELVDRAKEQKLSSFLTFPKGMNQEFVEEFEAQKEQAQQEPPRENTSVDMAQITKVHVREETRQEDYDADAEDSGSTSIFNVEDGDFDAELEVTEEAPMSTMETLASPIADTSAEDQWETRALGNQETEEIVKTEDDSDLEQFQSMELSSKDKLNLDDFLYKPERDGLTQTQPNPPPIHESTTATSATSSIPPSPQTMTPVTRSATQNIDLDEIEAIVRAHTQEIIKLNIQEMLPKIIEKIAREELEKILRQEMAAMDKGAP